MIVVEALIHRTFCCAPPVAVLTLAKNSTASTTKAEANDNRLSLWCLYTETCIALRVNHWVLLTRLVELAWLEVLDRRNIVQSWVELENSVVSLLLVQILVEKERIV